MASSEIVDSGRFAGQKSHFSQTCSLLSQYLKEKKGSFGDLSLGIHRNFGPPGTPTTPTPTPTPTMDLLPMIEKSAESPAKPMNLFPTEDSKSEQDKAQMTIFYGGQVVVFNDFPADKAKEIMLMASKGNNKQNPSKSFSCAMVPPKSAESVSDLVPSFGNQETQIPSQPVVSDLPIARRASLTRFLEKRKDRLTLKAPYQMIKEEVASPKVKESKAWLGLGAQFQVKTEL